MDLIERADLIADIKERRDYTDTSTAVGRGEYIALNKALTMIEEQPTVGAVSVVHCKECRWGHLCVFGQHLGLDGFCSKGERKEQSDG